MVSVNSSSSGAWCASRNTQYWARNSTSVMPPKPFLRSNWPGCSPAAARMRARMRAAAGEQPGQFDLKNGFGGITDVEFLAQYWVLREAHHAPELLEFTDTIRFLEGLESCGRVPAARLEGLVDAYLELRHSVHALALQGRPPVLPESLHEATRG